MGDNYETILLEADAQGVALLTINRPQVRNALNQAMVDEIGDALQSLAGRDNIRTLIITGAGDKAFLGGADIAELKARDAAAARRRINTNLFAQIERFPMPTIAAVRGFALGGGCELALACDFRLGADDAVFGFPETTLGIIPGAGGTQFLPRLVGVQNAKKMIYSGESINAKDAFKMGLIDELCKSTDINKSGMDLMNSFNSSSKSSIKSAKVAINQGIDLDIKSSLNIEFREYIKTLDTEERKEAQQIAIRRH